MHAPMYSLWVGGRLSYMGFANSFFINNRNEYETTGNFVKSGPALEIDVGARISRRYVPYVALDYAVVRSGNRFEGDDASASSTFLGLGFRASLGNVDNVAFLSDLSIGMRTVTLKNQGETFKMTALEIFRLGLGAEIRLSTLFVLSPMAYLSSSNMTDSSGSVPFSAAGSEDGLRRPSFRNGRNISSGETGYLVLGIGCGAHFDFFGK